MLLLLVFIVGIDLGKNVETWYKLRKMGIKILLAPVVVIAGTLGGAFFVSFFVETSTQETLAISAGFGWYSMSAVLLKTCEYRNRSNCISCKFFQGTSGNLFNSLYC